MGIFSLLTLAAGELRGKLVTLHLQHGKRMGEWEIEEEFLDDPNPSLLLELPIILREP